MAGRCLNPDIAVCNEVDDCFNNKDEEHCGGKGAENKTKRFLHSLYSLSCHDSSAVVEKERKEGRKKKKKEMA